MKIAMPSPKAIYPHSVAVVTSSSTIQLAVLQQLRRRPLRARSVVGKLAVAELRRLRRAALSRTISSSEEKIPGESVTTNLHMVETITVEECLGTQAETATKIVTQPEPPSPPKISGAAMKTSSQITPTSNRLLVRRDPGHAVPPIPLGRLAVPPAAKQPAGMTGEERVSLITWSALAVLLAFGFAVQHWWENRVPLAVTRPSPLEWVQKSQQQTTLDVDALVQLPVSEVLLLVDHADPAVRAKALAALIRQGALDALLKLQHHPLAAVRAAAPLAVMCLGQAAYDRADELATGIESPDSSVRDNTHYALRHLQSQFSSSRPAIARQR